MISNRKSLSIKNGQSRAIPLSRDRAITLDSSNSDLDIILYGVDIRMESSDIGKEFVILFALFIGDENSY